MIYRYSSRRKKMDAAFLNEKLKDAISYDRIAGYFSSSILEITGEAIEKIDGRVRVVCNGELQKEDVITVSAAVNAMWREWCSKKPEEKYTGAPERLKKLYTLIKSGKLQIKVLPNDVFGLIHGKAGVITFKDGRKTSFIGSVNETYAGWKLNYEILWEDDSEEGVKWVQDEFDDFWNSSHAVPLAELIIEDIKRIAERKVIYSIEEWKETPEPASAVVERLSSEFGLWQRKVFVNLLLMTTRSTVPDVLADTVGQGRRCSLLSAIMAYMAISPSCYRS